jgi:short-subunit dehydrogenase
MGKINKNRKVVLVTGCGSGLGLNLADQLFLLKSYRVVVTARIRSLAALRLRFAESERFIIRELDVTNTAQTHQLINEICCHWGSIDILINNAGVCFRSVVEHMDVASEMLQLKTNYLGPMTLIRSVLPMMRERGEGQIINISSASGVLAMPTMASYSASKHALEGASEALWYEAQPYGIKVSLVQPGFIRSESFKNVVLSKKAAMSEMLHGPQSEYYRSMAPLVEKFMNFSTVTHSDIAAKVISLFGKTNPPLRVAVTPDVKIFKFLRWLLPPWAFHRFIFLTLPGSKKWGNSKHSSSSKTAA